MNSNFEANLKKYHIEFFAPPAADPSSHGEGKLFLGSTVVRTDKDGEKEVDVKLNTLPGVAPVDVITVTVTEILSTHPDEYGSTSGFSAAINATSK